MKKNNVYSALICFLILLCQTALGHCKIIEIKTMRAVVPEIQSDTWVLIDVDDTIMNTGHHLSSGPWIGYFWHKGARLFPGKQNLLEAMMLNVTRRVPVQSVEKGIPELIEKLQTLPNVVSLGFTARSNVSVYNAEGFPESLTSKQLGTIGVDFNKTKFPRRASNFATIHQGIIYTSGKLKGPILKSIIERISRKPQRVIFIDDLYRQVKSVDDEMASIGMPCICYLYKRVGMMSPRFDPYTSLIQLQHLMRHDKLLSNHQAEALKKHPAEKHMDFLLRDAVDLFEKKHHVKYVLE